MQLKENKIYNYLAFFLISHLILWTLVPTISNINLPLDTIEALTWGNHLQLGYDKYPPLFPLFTELFFLIFGNQDWAYYLLSQIFVISSFFIIFKFSENFFNEKIYCFISVLLLEGIYFYNFTTPELNAFLCQFPFLAATAFFAWKSIKTNNNLNWFLLGISSGLAALTYYLSFYLLAALGLFFIYISLLEKKLNFKYFIALFAFFAILSPHLIWVIENNFTSIKYALFRSFDDPLSGLVGPKILDHLFYPLIFITKQLGLLIPFFAMFIFLINKLKIKINVRDKKLLFLFSIAILPIILMLLTSVISGARIRTMWMTSFYLFIGVFFVYTFKKIINIKKIKNFFLLFAFLFIFSPTLYYLVSYVEKNKRTDYPGREIAKIVQTKWNQNFTNKIELVIGDGWIDGGWFAGNLSYHLKSRPQVKSNLNDASNIGTVLIKGFNKITNCKGIKFQISPFNDICMLGKK